MRKDGNRSLTFFYSRNSTIDLVGVIAQTPAVNHALDASGASGVV